MLSRAVLFGFATAFACFAAPVPQAQAQIHLVQRCDTNIRFVNNSSSTVTRIFYNPTGNRNWGPDRLPGNVLRPGQGTTFRLGNEVPYDFRIVWESTATAELRSADICRISEIVVTNQGLRVR